MPINQLNFRRFYRCTSSRHVVHAKNILSLSHPCGQVLVLTGQVLAHSPYIFYESDGIF